MFPSWKMRKVGDQSQARSTRRRPELGAGGIRGLMKCRRGNDMRKRATERPRSVARCPKRLRHALMTKGKTSPAKPTKYVSRKTLSMSCVVCNVYLFLPT